MNRYSEIDQVESGDSTSPPRTPSDPAGGDASPRSDQVESGDSTSPPRSPRDPAGDVEGTKLGHQGVVRCVKFLPDGSGRFVSCSNDKTVRVWSVHTGQQVGMMSGDVPIWEVDVWPDSSGRIVSADDGKDKPSLRIWNVQTGNLVRRIECDSRILALCVSPDGRYILSSHREEICRWDASSGEQVFPSLSGKGIGVIHSMCRWPDGSNKIASTGPFGERVFRVWEAEDEWKNNGIGNMEMFGMVRSVCVFPDCKHVVVGENADKVTVLNRLNEVHVLQIEMPGYECIRVCVSPDGSRIVSAGKNGLENSEGGDHEAFVWNAENGDEIRRLEGHIGPINSVCYSPDGDRIVTCSDDMTIRIWDAATGLEVNFRTLQSQKISGRSRVDSDDGKSSVAPMQPCCQSFVIKRDTERLTHKGKITTLCMSSDGALILSGGKDASIFIWDAQTGQQKHHLRGHEGAITSACFSWDNLRVLSASKADGTIYLWNTTTGNRESLEGHTEHVTGLCFSQDGTRAVSTSADKSLRIWDLESREVIFQQEEKEILTAVSVHPRGNVILVASEGDKTLCGYKSLEREEPDAEPSAPASDNPDNAALPPPRRRREGRRVPKRPVYDLSLSKYTQGAVDKSIYKAHHKSPVLSCTIPSHGHFHYSISDDVAIVWKGMSSTPSTLLPSDRYHIECMATASESAERLVVTGGRDKLVRLWNFTSGGYLEETLRLPGHTGVPTSILLPPQSGRVVTGSWDTVRVWNIVSSRRVLQLEGQGNIIKSVTFTPDGNSIVTTYVDKAICVWDSGTGLKRPELDEASRTLSSASFPAVDSNYTTVHAVSRVEGTAVVEVWSKKGNRISRVNGAVAALSPDGNTILTGAKVGREARCNVVRWDAETGLEISILGSHSQKVTCICFSADGTYAVTGSSDQTVATWDLSSSATGLRAAKHEFTGNTRRVNAVCMSPCNGLVVSGGRDKSVCVWDRNSGELRKRWIMKGDASISVHSVCAISALPSSPSIENTLIVSSASNAAIVWDLYGRAMHTIDCHGMEITSVAVSPDGRLLACGCEDVALVYELSIWEEALNTSGHNEAVTAVCGSADGSYFASGSADHSVRLWHSSTGHEMKRLEGHTSVVTAVCILPGESNKVASSQEHDGIVLIWDTASEKVAMRLEGHSDTVWCLCVSADGSRLISGGEDTTIRIWSTAKGNQMHKLEGSLGAVKAVSLSNDGTCLVSGGDDMLVRVWDPASALNRPPKPLKGHKGPIRSVCISPKGNDIIVSGSDDGTLKVWDANTGEDRMTLDGHTGTVESVCISSDGRRIISGSGDSTLRVWNIEIGQEMLKLGGHKAGVRSLSTFTVNGDGDGDGGRVVSGSDDYSLRVWEGLSLASLATFTDQFFETVVTSPPALLYYILAGDKTFAVDAFKAENSNIDIYLLTPESLDAFIQKAVSRQDVEVLRTLAEVLYLANQSLLRSNMDCLIRMQTLASPSPRNLETLLADPYTRRWMNIVLDSPGPVRLVLCTGPLHLLHLILYSIVAYQGQNQDNLSSSLSAVLVVMLCLNVFYTLYEAVHVRSMYTHGLFYDWITDFWNLTDMGALLCTYLLFGYAYSGSAVNSGEGYRVLGAIGAAFLWVRLLGFMRLLSLKLATFVLALFQVFKDLRSFLLVLIVLIFLFTEMFYIIGHPREEDAADGMFDSVDSTFIVLYGMMIGQYFTDEFESSSLLMALNVLYMFLMAIIMLNILIAIVSDSYDSAMIRARALFTRAKFEFAAEQVAMRDALGWHFDSDGKSLLHVNINDDENQPETEWLGRALDMEHRVSRVVGKSRDEVKAEVDALREEFVATMRAVQDKSDSVSGDTEALRREVEALRQDNKALRAALRSDSESRKEDTTRILSEMTMMMAIMKGLAGQKEGEGGDEAQGQKDEGGDEKEDLKESN